MRRSLLASFSLLLLASACGARSELAVGQSAGTGGLGGAGGSCATPACVPAPGPGGPVWSQLYGSAGQQSGANIVADSAGNLVVVGGLSGPDAVDFGCGALSEPAGTSGMFVVKLDRCRACAWSRAFPAGATKVAVSAAGDTLVIGGFAGDAIDLGGTVLTSPGGGLFVASLDGSGAVQWAQVVGDGASQATGLAVDGEGDVLVSGVGSASTFVSKLGPDGTPAWSRSFEGSAQVWGLATDAAGDALLTGTFETSVDFGCGALAGMANEFLQPFAVALDSGGTCRWSRSFAAPDAAHAYGVAAGAAGDVVSTGSFNDTIDLGGGPLTGAGASSVYVAALHADGSFAWGKAFGNVEGGLVAMNGAGDVFFDGLLFGPTDFGGGTIDGTGVSLFVASLDATGSYRWAVTVTIGESSTGTIAVDGSSGVLLTGGVGGTIDFGCGTQASASPSDVFIAELAQ